MEHGKKIKELLTNIVTNNKELTEDQKLGHLHSALRSEVELLEILDYTFDSQFKALENRFENLRIILNIHLILYYISKQLHLSHLQI